MKKRVLVLLCFLILTSTYYCWGIWNPNRPAIFTDTGRTGATATQENFYWLNTFISTFYGYYTGGVWMDNIDTTYAGNHKFKGPIRTGAASPGTMKTGEIRFDNSTGLMVLKAYNSILGVEETIGNYTSAGVSGIDEVNGGGYEAGYVNIGGYPDSGIITNKASQAGPKTVIAITNTWGAWEEEYITQWDYGYTSPTYSRYGSSDYASTWANEFGYAGTPCAGFKRCWKENDYSSVSYPTGIGFTCFVPAIGYPTQTVRMNIISSLFKGPTPIVTEITPSRANNWKACSITYNPVYAASSTQGITHTYLIPIPSTKWAVGLSGICPDINIYRTNYTGTLTTTFNILDVWFTRRKLTQ